MSLNSRLEKLEKTGSGGDFCLCVGKTQIKTIGLDLLQPDYWPDEIRDQNELAKECTEKRCDLCGKLQYTTVVVVEWINSKPGEEANLL